MEVTQLPARPSLEQYRKQAKELLKAFKAGDPRAIQRIKKKARRQAADSAISLSSAQFTIAREHGFESWPKLSKHLAALARAGSPISKFEQAADAIVTGDIASLERLLRENPSLVRARSSRAHGAPLLHYVAANGVEDFRQKTPKNAVAVTKMLLDAGAEIDAVTDVYGGRSTALGLAATSVHPLRAGVQIELMDLLLEYGASPDGVGGDKGWSPLNAALANGRQEAAEFLARRGARIDLEGAAGVGWLDLVKEFFRPDGKLKDTATRAQMEAGFMWACEYGRTEVVKFLLEAGVDPALQIRGFTGLHWAAHGGHLDTAKLLVKHDAPLDAKNEFGGTPLDQAIWSSENSGLAVDFSPVIEFLEAAEKQQKG